MVNKKTSSKSVKSSSSENFAIVSKIERVPIGIPDFDLMINGGLIKGSPNLLTGTTGTGKTIFATQFLFNGLKQGEAGLYISVEQETETVLRDCKLLGMDFEPFIKNKKCEFIDVLPLTFDELEKMIFDKAIKMDVKRLVIDSVSILLMTTKDMPKIKETGITFEKLVPSQLRRNLFKLTKRLRSMGITSILVSEVPTTDKLALSRLGFEEYLTDSIIRLSMFEYGGGKTPRSLQIIKMRSTKHDKNVHPFEIRAGGIKIAKPEEGVVI